MDEKGTILEEHKENVRRNRMTSSKFWKISAIVLLVLLVVVVAINGLPTVSSKNTVAANTVDYVNAKLLNGYATATLNSVETEGDLYKLDVTILATTGSSQDATLYVTKDGNLLFPTAIDTTGSSIDTTDDTPESTQTEDYVIDTTDEPFIGNPDGTIVMVEFSDFQCPYCGRAADTLDELLVKYPELKIVFKNYPLSFHENAQKAGEASECAYAQGKFEEYYQVLFDNQEALSVDELKQYAADLGLDTEAFNTCLDSGEMEAEVKADETEGASLGVTGTPAFFIGNQNIVGARPLADFEAAVEKELAS